MNLMVTGGAGFIGSAFVRTALAGGYPGLGDVRLTVLDRLSYAGNHTNLAPVIDHAGLRLVVGDIRDADLVEKLMPGHDAVLHVAAETHVDRSIASGAEFASTNVVGTQVLLEAAVRHGMPRFVQVSTDEVYGSIGAGRWDESAPLDPSSAYSASKAGGDLLALAYHRTHGLPVVVTRCANNYGPYQHPEKLIPRFVTRLLEGRTVSLYGDGEHVRDWLHVDDHCRALALALAGGRPGRVYHVGGGTELTNRQVTGLLLDACGAGWDAVEHVVDRKGHDRRYALTDDRIRAELGYAPHVDFAAGLAATVAWYRSRRDWWGPLIDG
jgi:dTDP-glucose 4,6-dehydratase